MVGYALPHLMRVETSGMGNPPAHRYVHIIVLAEGLKRTAMCWRRECGHVLLASIPCSLEAKHALPPGNGSLSWSPVTRKCKATFQLTIREASSRERAPSDPHMPGLPRIGPKPLTWHATNHTCAAFQLASYSDRANFVYSFSPRKFTCLPTCTATLPHVILRAAFISLFKHA